MQRGERRFMNQILKATKKDIPEIKHIMDTGLASVQDKTWYVVDDVEFLERHVEEEGYILKYMAEDVIAGFLVVRHPGMAEDNLGRYLQKEDKVTHMESAAVLPKFRGQKIQKKLLQKAEELEKERGTKYLMCTVHPDNIYSAGNLEQLGYGCLLEVEKYGGLKRKIMYKEMEQSCSLPKDVLQ